MAEQYKRLREELRGGGFSEHLPTGGKPAPNKFMVSDYGSEERIAKPEVNASRLEHFAKGHKLDQAPSGVFMGGWSPQDQGDDFLDVSREYPDPHRAQVAMEMGNQMSAYDTNKAPTDDDAYVDNPHYDPSYTPEEHARRMASPVEPALQAHLRPSREPKITLRTAQPRKP
jgi:hypothetical protein